MKVQVYCLLDSATNEYSMPFFSENDDTACRTVADYLAQDNLHSRHAVDFSLVCAGEIIVDNELSRGRPVSTLARLIAPKDVNAC